MAQDGDWSKQDYDPDLMTPGAYNLDGESMESLPSEHDDMLSWLTEYDVSVNASSSYHTVSHSELFVLTWPAPYEPFINANEQRRRGRRRNPLKRRLI